MTAPTNTSRKRRTTVATRGGACAALLIGITLSVLPGDPDEASAKTTSKSSPGRPTTPAVALADLDATIDAAANGVSGAADKAVADLLTFMQDAEVADDKSMKAAGADAKADLDKVIADLLKKSQSATPAADSLTPTWTASAADACTQRNGTDVGESGTAQCTTNGDADDSARARAEGDGAAAKATAHHDGDADAKAQGKDSAATATSGDKKRTGQKGNASDAIATAGSKATANSGLGDHDQRDQATAAAHDKSLATADSMSGDRNDAFAGASDNGEAHATAKYGDRNQSLALGFDGSNDGSGPAGANAMTLMGFDNQALSVVHGPNAAATTNAAYGDRHKAAATAGPNSSARADAAQGEENSVFAGADERGHSLAYTSYGDDMVAVATSKGDGSSGLCTPIGQSGSSGETTYPLDACASANARAVDGETNTAISTADDAKAFSLAERGKYNTAITKASNGGDIVWNTAKSTASQPANPHEGMTADCPWPLPPLPQAQQPCGNATAKASYGDGNLAVAVPDGDHVFTWSEASGGSYNQTLATGEGKDSQSRARAIYNNYGTAKSAATDGGVAESLTVIGYENVALANAFGIGSKADATAAGPHAQATATASKGGTATAAHNTTTTTGFLGVNLTTGVSCSDDSVAYALIGTGQSCGSGF